MKMYQQDDVTYIAKHNVMCPNCGGFDIVNDKQQPCFNIDQGCVSPFVCKICGYSFSVIYIVTNMNDVVLEYVGTFYGEEGKYDLYLFPKSTEKMMNWHEAKEYCESSGGDLPTIGELQFIYDNGLNKNFKQGYYWVYTEDKYPYAYRYHFFFGNVGVSTKCGTSYVRAVKRCTNTSNKE